MGFATLLASLGGVIWGIFGGALPGISPSIAMALLLPFTYGMEPVTAIVLLASVYVGAEYGGSIPAILIRTPGTNSAAATTIDGYELAKQGRAGEALGISLMSGLVGGLFGLVVLVLATEPLAAVALAFTPPAYFALGILGLSVIASLAGGSLLKGLIAAFFGLMVATVGTDPVSGVTRFTFGSPELLGGIRPILVMVGLFAVAEMLEQISAPAWSRADARDTRLKLPNLAMWKRLWKSQAIGCSIGTFEGVTPGAGGTIAAFMAYNEARRWSNHPEEFGKGSVEGVAAPECANNVVTATALVPLLSLGIPGSNSAAVLLGGFMIHGLMPGPLLFQKAPDVVYGLYGGLFAANIFMVLVGLVILTPCIWLVNRPKPYLMGYILALVCTGVYAIDQSLFDLGLVLGMGVIGYAMRRFGVPILPLVLGVVLGFLVESNYRRSLVLSSGDHAVFVQDWVALGLLAASVLLTGYSLIREFKPEMTTIAERLAEACLAAKPTPEVAAMAQTLLIDIAGICVAARATDFLVAARKGVDEGGPCTAIGLAGGFSAADAAMLNGVAAHGEDFDDTFEGGPVHAGAVILPAVLATAERHKVSGRTAMRAVAIGTEITCRLSVVVPKATHKAGFHPTAVFGAIGAAAAAGTALGLTQAQLVHALGIAGSMASGIIEYLAEGTWTKRLHPGWAAQSGYRAARLAAGGFTGPRTLFEGTHGLFHGFAHKIPTDWSGLLDGFGKSWVSETIAFKPYACGTMIHPYIDCAKRLAARGLDLSKIASIECETAEGILHRLWEPLADKQNPPNGYAAKFSIPYGIAAGLVLGQGGLAAFADAQVADKRLAGIARKVTYVVDPDNPYPKRFTGHMRVTLADGSVVEERQPHFRGGSSEPLARAEIVEKFRLNCRHGGWEDARTARLLAFAESVFGADAPVSLSEFGG